MQRSTIVRLQRELKSLRRNPPEGVTVWLQGDALNRLEALLIPMPNSPYEDGTFRLDIVVGDRYPMEPPQVQFRTPVYHPNIDSAGRICLNTLKTPPKGCWTPALSIATLLTSVRILLAQPNPDDPLMMDITAEYKNNYALFLAKARELTHKHAVQTMITSSATPGDASSSPQSETTTTTTTTTATTDGASVPSFSSPLASPQSGSKRVRVTRRQGVDRPSPTKKASPSNSASSLGADTAALLGRSTKGPQWAPLKPEEWLQRSVSLPDLHV